MANVTITQLPQAGAITGQELVPVVQNGQTVQTTTAAISASPSQNTDVYHRSTKSQPLRTRVLCLVRLVLVWWTVVLRATLKSRSMASQAV
jgi:hypothetical protein